VPTAAARRGLRCSRWAMRVSGPSVNGVGIRHPDILFPDVSGHDASTVAPPGVVEALRRVRNISRCLYIDSR